MWFFPALCAFLTDANMYKLVQVSIKHNVCIHSTAVVSQENVAIFY